MADKTKVKESVYCDFCGKSRDEVKKMIVGNEVAICNECVDLCSNILNKEIEVELERKQRLVLVSTIQCLLQTISMNTS